MGFDIIEINLVLGKTSNFLRSDFSQNSNKLDYEPHAVGVLFRITLNGIFLTCSSVTRLYYLQTVRYHYSGKHFLILNH